MKEWGFRNQFLGFRYDWRVKLARCLGVSPGDWEGISRGIACFQRLEGLEVTGLMTAETRLKWITRHPEFGIQLTGCDLEVGRILIPVDLACSCEWEFDVWTRFLSWGKYLGVFMPEGVGTVSIWGIRGLVQSEEKCAWVQTDSAWRFCHEEYGGRDHFSSLKADYLDTCFALLWHDVQGNAHVRLFQGTCNPGSIWPHGTAHLCSGQYFYKLGRHRTREADHIQAVLERSELWPSHWVTDRTQDSVQYYALESVSPIEVIRSSGGSLDISSSDVHRAEVGIAHREPTFVDQNLIKINIHTCAETHASSLGCMNIVPEQYGDFIGILERLTCFQRERYGFALDIPFYLCDASMLA